MVEHHKSNIQNIILRELFKAQSSIKIAVAWFTNDLLFQPLLLKLQTGVKVTLVLNSDEINFSSENSLDFQHFVEIGGILHLNRTKTLMHNKFCIVDDSVVITGTYNWTNKAERNDETIIVITNDENLILSHITQFNELTQKYPVSLSTELSTRSIQEISDEIIDKEPFRSMAKVHGFINIMEDADIPEHAIITIGQYINSDTSRYLESVLDYHTLKPILPYEYSDTAYMNTKEGTIWLKKGIYWALFNVRKKRFLTQFSFTNITGWGWGNDYCIVKLNGHYGVCNSKGEIVVPCVYDSIDKNGGITQKDGLFGVIGQKEEKCPPICTTIDLDGKPSKVGNKYGLLSDGFCKDKDGNFISRGKVVLDFKYDEIKFHGYIDYDMGNFYVLRQGDKYGLYFRSQDKIIECGEYYERYSKYNAHIDLIISILHGIAARKFKKK